MIDNAIAMRVFKIGFLVICILIIVGVATVTTAYLVVMYSSSPRQYSDVSKIPYVRCKKVFGQERVTIISQGYHNARAFYLAKCSGIDAIGYDAKDIKRTRTYYIYGVGREALARIKMFGDLVLGKQPKFLGEMIEI